MTSGQVLKALEMARHARDGNDATFGQRDQEVVAMCEMYLDRKGEFWNLCDLCHFFGGRCIVPFGLACL